MDMELVTLNRKEQKRAFVLGKIDRGELTAAQAGKVMDVSIRQVRRLLAEYRREGPKALAHGNRGRKPAHALDPSLCSRVIELAQDKYQGFNWTHFTEKLEKEGIYVSRSTVGRILTGVGLKGPRKRRPPKHRKRRERRPQAGMMMQVDGSRHDWLEGRGPYLTLVGMIDDATGEVPCAQFREQEDAQGYFLILKELAMGRGLPLAIYSDQHGIFRRLPKEALTVEEELAGERQPTQFGRLLKELEIEAIFALSPQAKGRIERLWGTFQDRLVSELRLAGAKTLAEANRVLAEFLPQYNARFAVAPANAVCAYRPLPKSWKLEELFCFKYERQVGNDNVVKLGTRTIAIPEGPRGRSYAKARVMVHEGMDGSLGVYYQGQRIAFEEAPAERVVLRVKNVKAKAQPAPGLAEPSPPCPAATKGAPKPTKTDSRPPFRPPADHPWRRPHVVTNSLNR
jgi:transposase